jgi:choline dehydrogenase
LTGFEIACQQFAFPAAPPEEKRISSILQEFDYVIVGAGSAGCVLANRLEADLSKSILVLEAGPMDRDIFIHLPAGVYRAWRDPKLNWNYVTQPEVELNHREVINPRGKVVGGSSSINSMVYMRGHPFDYDGWAQDLGLNYWSFDQCLPYFKAGECYANGADAYRGAMALWERCAVIMTIRSTMPLFCRGNRLDKVTRRT